MTQIHNNASLNNSAFHSELERLKNDFDSIEPVLELTVKDDSMDVEGFVVVWNTSIAKSGPLFENQKGCGKGGTRIKDGLTLEEVRRLARAMAEKNAAAGLPLGGAKSGLNANPDAPDYEAKWKRFVRLVKDEGVLYEDGGVFGGFGYDIGGKPPLNALWTIEELGSGRSFTGKPIGKGGTDYDKIGIAGLGVAVAGKTLMELHGQPAQGSTFSVQGVGAMGSAVIRYFSEYGTILKYISDPKYGGTWKFESGGASKQFIETPTLEILQNEAVKISSENEGALFEDVDIIFPCAMEDTITQDNVNRIQAKYMSEGANNPTTGKAHELLFEKGIKVVPDILANPGGIIAAYVEMTSSSDNKSQEAIDITKKRVASNVEELVTNVKKFNTSPDLVADYMTYKKILE